MTEGWRGGRENERNRENLERDRGEEERKRQNLDREIGERKREFRGGNPRVESLAGRIIIGKRVES